MKLLVSDQQRWNQNKKYKYSFIKKNNWLINSLNKTNVKEVKKTG